MKKRNIVLIVIVLIVALILSILLIKNNNSNTNSNNITLIQYEIGNSKPIKKINIDSTDDINKISMYVEKLKPLTAIEMVDLALLTEIEIRYNNDISIYIQLGEKSYCYYTDKKRNILSLSKMPNGLYEWVEEKIKYGTDGKEETIASDNEFVDNEIDSLINSTEYSKMSDNDKKYACEKLLKELEIKGKIKYFSYSNLEMMYSFEYRDGTLGGIKIKQWDSYMN